MADFSVSVPLGNKTDQKLSSPFLIKKTCILFSKTCLLIHDMEHERVEIKLYNLDTFKKQIDVNFIDLDSELVDLNYKVESLIFCHFWRSISLSYQRQENAQVAIYLSALDPASESLLIIHLDDELLPLIDSARLENDFRRHWILCPKVYHYWVFNYFPCLISIWAKGTCLQFNVTLRHIAQFTSQSKSELSL